MNFKNTLRKEIDNKLSGISPEDKHNLSIKLTNNLVSSRLWRKSERVFLYLSFRNEVITDYIIKKAREQNKKIFAPLISDASMEFHRIDNLKPGDLIKNRYGIMEPPEGLDIEIPERDDLILIPGVGFSFKGERLGRGGGFYDRYLSSYSDIIKVGISFEVQISNTIPTEEWDIYMDYILTEKELYKTGEHNGNN